MINYCIPDPLIDTQNFPPLIHTSDPGSFAHNTLKKRVPDILRQVVDVNDFPAPVRSNLESLWEELVYGRIRLLQEATADRAFWDAVTKPFVGRSWLDVPWFWAEAYFYRRILEATRYFHSGPTHLQDPFQPIKDQEWHPQAAPHTVDHLLAGLPADSGERFLRLFHAALWGNRVDLSYNVAGHLGSSGSRQAERHNLLVDDSESVWQHVRRGLDTLIYITDNAGTELLLDMALAHDCLQQGLVRRVILHVKPQPYFVSDAMPKDVDDALRALAQGGEQAQRLGVEIRQLQHNGSLQISTHWFYTSSLFYYQLPADLLARLAAADLVIVKGDANYRRLLGDAHWPPTTPFSRVLSYFPAPVVALRTFKAEIIVGLQPGQAEALARQNPDWLVNGRRGVIQACGLAV